MKLTPYDRRQITLSIEQLPDADRRRWSDWTARFGGTDESDDVPYEIADVALRALTAEAKSLEWRMQQPDLHEDTLADLGNDLLTVRHVADVIRAENVGH